MNRLMLISAGLLALSACARTPAPALDIVTAAPPTNMTSSQGYQRSNGVQSGLMGAAPDNLTGSQAYQSPDLDDSQTQTQARPPRRGTGSQAYQRSGRH